MQQIQTQKKVPATIADAILDRIVHDSYTIEIRGTDEHSQKSMRVVYGVGSR